MRVAAAKLAAAAAVAALGGCWVPMERGRQMEARIQRLEVQGEEQKEQVRDRVARMDQKIQEVQAKIDELNKAARRSGADLGVQLGRLADDFNRVKGDLEVAQHELVQLQKTLVALETRTEGRFAALRGAGALDEYEAKQRLASLPKGEEKGALLALAQKEEKEGDKGVASQLYEEYVRRYPSDPKTAEAQFRAAELHFDQKRWREALLAYGKVAEGFPRSELAPEAMLGAAEAMVQLEMRDDARDVLGQLLEKYPRSGAAPRAKERLAQLAPPPQPASEKKAEKKKPAPKKK